MENILYRKIRFNDREVKIVSKSFYYWSWQNCCQVKLILWKSYLLSSSIRLLTTQLLWKYKFQSHEKNVWIDRYLHTKDLPTQEELLGKHDARIYRSTSQKRWSEVRTNVNGLKEMNGVQSYKRHLRYHQESTEEDIMVLKNLGF